MLKQFSYKVVAMFMLILFIAASTGLNFYIHICNCEQSTFTSILKEHKCHEDIATPSCCDNLTNDGINFSNSDCGCKSLKLTIKIDDIFNSSDYTSAETHLFSFQIINSEQSNLGLVNSNHLQLPTNGLYTPDISPHVKPVGRILINILHQPKTPEFIS
ncbi:MAG: hypothetical protein HXX16_11830 [Bacteroidales bacterium]|nr:hypothetical protein [Bacteroidales bacterium]